MINSTTLLGNSTTLLVTGSPAPLLPWLLWIGLFDWVGLAHVTHVTHVAHVTLVAFSPSFLPIYMGG
jgi:hypothetical protein